MAYEDQQNLNSGEFLLIQEPTSNLNWFEGEYFLGAQYLIYLLEK